MAMNPFDDDDYGVEEAPEAAAEVSAEAWDGSVSATFKGSGEYSSSWYVVKAPSFERLAEMLEDEASVKRALKAAYEVDKIVKQADRSLSNSGSQSQQKSGGYQKKQGGKPGEPEGATKAPNGRTERCDHGDMIYRSGMGKSGKPWKAFFCPEKDRNAQCEPVWV